MALPRVPRAFSSLVEDAAKPFVQFGLSQVALDINHLLRKPLPHLLVDMVDVEFRGDVADKACQHAMKLITPAFGGAVGPGNADQCKLLRQHFSP